MIKIWNPRWKDRMVLVAKYKVVSGINKIMFTKSKCLKDKVYTLSGAAIKKFPLETNGKISCYAVPLDSFEVE